MQKIWTIKLEVIQSHSGWMPFLVFDTYKDANLFIIRGNSLCDALNEIIFSSYYKNRITDKLLDLRHSKDLLEYENVTLGTTGTYTFDTHNSVGNTVITDTTTGWL